MTTPEGAGTGVLSTFIACSGAFAVAFALTDTAADFDLFFFSALLSWELLILSFFRRESVSSSVKVESLENRSWIMSDRASSAVFLSRSLRRDSKHILNANESTYRKVIELELSVITEL